MAFGKLESGKNGNQCHSKRTFAQNQSVHLGKLLLSQNSYSESFDLALDFTLLLFFSLNTYHLGIKEASSKLLTVPDIVTQLVNFLSYEHNVLI